MNKIKLLFCLLLSFVSLLSFQKISDSYSIDNSIYYDGKNKSFVFNGDDLDVLNELKELMPGDKKEQIIRVNINNINHDINMFVTLVKEQDDVLEVLNIKLYKADQLIFNNGEYNKPINIYSDNVPNSFDLKLVVEVPKELGNELAGSTSNFQWTFMVEDYGQNIEVSNPNTSVGTNIYVYFGLLFVSIFLIIILIMSMVNDTKNDTKRESN